MILFLFILIDLNECSIGTHNCSQICINTMGSYRCACSRGHWLERDERTCRYLGFD